MAIDERGNSGIQFHRDPVGETMCPLFNGGDFRASRSEEFGVMTNDLTGFSWSRGNREFPLNQGGQYAQETIYTGTDRSEAA